MGSRKTQSESDRDDESRIDGIGRAFPIEPFSGERLGDDCSNRSDGIEQGDVGDIADSPEVFQIVEEDAVADRQHPDQEDIHRQFWRKEVLETEDELLTVSCISRLIRNQVGQYGTKQVQQAGPDEDLFHTEAGIYKVSQLRTDHRRNDGADADIAETFPQSVQRQEVRSERHRYRSAQGKGDAVEDADEDDHRNGVGLRIQEETDDRQNIGKDHQMFLVEAVAGSSGKRPSEEGDQTHQGRDDAGQFHRCTS